MDFDTDEKDNNSIQEEIFDVECSDIVFFMGLDQQTRNDTRIVDSNKSATLKNIVHFHGDIDGREVDSTYENNLIKSSNKHIYFFGTPSTLLYAAEENEEDEETYDYVDSLLKNVYAMNLDFNFKNPEDMQYEEEANDE